jgi:hypothetical protein
LLCEEIGIVVIVAKPMEMLVDMAEASVMVSLHWSVVDWADCADCGETIDLSSFQLGPFFCAGL